MDIRDVLAHNIAGLRTSMNMSRKQLADKVESHENVVARWENAQAFPEPHKVKKLGEAFGVDPLLLYQHDDIGKDYVKIPRVWARRLVDLYKGVAAVSPGAEPLPPALTLLKHAVPLAHDFATPEVGAVDIFSLTSESLKQLEQLGR